MVSQIIEQNESFRYLSSKLEKNCFHDHVKIVTQRVGTCLFKYQIQSSTFAFAPQYVHINEERRRRVQLGN